MIGKLVPLDQRVGCPVHGPFNSLPEGGEYEILDVREVQHTFHCIGEHWVVRLPSILVGNENGVGRAPRQDLIIEEEINDTNEQSKGTTSQNNSPSPS